VILGDTLRFLFTTVKPLTGEIMDSSAAPVITVYNNGVLLAPAAPPVIANVAVGRYSLTYGLTAANGHAANDWITITARVVLDGVAITFGIWEGNLVEEGSDVTLMLGLRIYPLVTTHRPSNGENADNDPDALLGGGFVVRGYRDFVGLGFGVITVALNPEPGVYIMSLILNPPGWVAGQRLDMTAQVTIDTIQTGQQVFFSGGQVVPAGGPAPAAAPAAFHHEVIGALLKIT